jgi:hypothetical protein
MRRSLSTYVVSSQPVAESGAVMGIKLSSLNCKNLTATLLLLSGVSTAVTELKKGYDSLFLALSLGASAADGSLI